VRYSALAAISTTRVKAYIYVPPRVLERNELCLHPCRIRRSTADTAPMTDLTLPHTNSARHYARPRCIFRNEGCTCQPSKPNDKRTFELAAPDWIKIKNPDAPAATRIIET
jgi:hypothetical protein